jgi:lipoate-protein ligase A
MHCEVGRLMISPPGSPAENMAIDQAILDTVDRGGPPTLRLYGWSQPTVSLGYFQAIAQRGRHPSSESLECVRRVTGGGAIVHDRELTYSFALASGDRQPGARELWYRDTHRVIAEVLSDFGVPAVPHRQLPAAADPDAVAAAADPFLCFQRRSPEDLVVAGYKVLGSAQRRARRAILQHGSLLIRCSRWAPELPGIVELSSRSIAEPQLIDAVAEAVTGVLPVRAWQACSLEEPERRSADRLVESRFGNPHWLQRR